MHYTFFCPSIALGGLELQMAGRTRDALQRGETATLLATPESQLEGHARTLGIPTERLRLRSRYADLPAVWTLGGMLRASDSKICVVGMTRHIGIALAARDLRSAGTAVLLYHQMKSRLRKRDPYHDWMYRRLDGVVTLTELSKRLLCETTALSPDRIAVIPYGIEVERYAPERFDRAEVRLRFGLPPDRFLIGVVARLDPQKDQVSAVRALARAEVPDAMLVLVGEETAGEGGYRAVIETAIRELGLNDRVRLLPFTPDVPALMNCLDLLVLPSRSEAFGLVLVEAMAAGLPVLATASGGVPEIVQEDRNGFLFPPGDLGRLAGLLGRLYRDSVLRRRLSRQARADAAERYNGRRQTDLFFDFCREVQARRLGRRRRRVPSA